jgi:hypothetical protein
MVTLPEAQFPTIAVIIFRDGEYWKEAAGTPPKLTLVTNERLIPKIPTSCPVVAAAGERNSVQFL